MVVVLACGETLEKPGAMFVGFEFGAQFFFAGMEMMLAEFEFVVSLAEVIAAVASVAQSTKVIRFAPMDAAPEGGAGLGFDETVTSQVKLGTGFRPDDTGLGIRIFG